jgi:alcohol dehydrogenase class IV
MSMEISHYCPTQILMGKDCIVTHATKFALYGKKALLVTGRYSAKANGSFQDVKRALAVNGQTFCVFDSVMSNPTVTCVFEGSTFARREKVDFVIAIGGGSAMDAAKAIALLACQKLSEEQLFSGSYGPEILPLICIPTTAGTGSEVTQYSVLTDEKAEIKRNIVTPLFFPTLALLDATYLCNLKGETRINTAIDALSHSVEGLLTVRTDSISEAYAYQAIRLIASCFPSLKKGTVGFEENEKLLVASTLGGMVISSTGTTVVHALGYSLTYFYHVDHGKANGLLLGSFLRFVAKTRKDVVTRILEAMDFESVEDFDALALPLLGESVKVLPSEQALYAEKVLGTRYIDNCLAKPCKADLLTLLESSLS